MNEIRLSLPHNWNPRPYQRGLWDYLRKGGKRAVACWHRRAGKDDICLHATASAAFERAGNYWHMLPEYSQARKAIWDAVNPHTGKRRIDEAFPVDLRKFTRENEMMIGFSNGSTWQVVGCDNYNSLMGTTPAGMILSEYALSNPSAWGYLSPILEENNGWAAFISTPRGNNHFKGMCTTAQREEGWFYSKLTNDDTGVFTQTSLDSKLRELCDIHPEQYAKSLWLQEYFCSFDAAIPGSIWGDCIERAEREGRIVDFDVDPRNPVYTAWDLGRTDDTAIWFYQFNGGKIDVIDYFASPFMDIDNEEEPKKGLVQTLLERAKAYRARYERHWLPHDARPRTLAAGGKSILQQFHDAAEKHKELGNFAIVKRLDKQEGVQAARATFPHVRFHKTRCAKGIEALKHYHREWDDEKKMFSDQAQHDWSSHGCFVGTTEVLTRYGTHQIMDLPDNGEVLTPCGFKRYTKSWITSRNAPLVEVRFIGGYTVKCTPDHPFLTENGWKSAESLTKDSLIQSSLTRSRSISMAVCTAYGRAKDTCLAAAENFIGMFGNPHSDLSLQIAISTTATRTRQTTYSGIWNVCQPKFTWGCQTSTASFLKKHEQEQPPGTLLRKGACGTGATPNEQKAGQSGSALKNLVSIAAIAMSALKEKAAIIRNSVLRTARQLRIESVVRLNETSDVWCLHVPDGQYFSLKNGAVVHNSDAFRYLSLSWKQPRAHQSPEAPLVDRLTRGSIQNQTFGEMKKKHFSKMRDKREAVFN